MIRNCNFGDLGPPFWYLVGLIFALGHYLGDPWVHRDTEEDTLGSRVGFSSIFDGFWDPLGSRFL